MFCERADTGDAEKILQFTKKSLLVIAGEVNGRGSHGVNPFSGELENWELVIKRKRHSIPRRIRAGCDAIEPSFS
jgi:hypothetical protein